MPQQAWNIDAQEYKKLYEYSIEHSDEFWAAQAEKSVSWIKKWHTVQSWDFHTANIRWYDGATLNVSANCLDRHLASRGDKTAIIWEPDDPKDAPRYLSYRELYTEVCKCANVLRNLGVDKGDRVCIYLPMIPEAAITMLACTRIGAIHSVVFGGFSPEALAGRINDSQCKLLITSDQCERGGRFILLKENADKACEHTPSIENVLVVHHCAQDITWVAGRDRWYHEEMAKVDSDNSAREMEAEDPLFILYTSGSTGQPKGVLHTSGGYLVYAATTFKYVFDYREDDIYWCTADVGWITGHSYIVYGPLCNGATVLMFEGTPAYPDPSRFWQVVDRHQVSLFYTAPTAIRALIARGDAFVSATSRSSLRVLGTVGEPINPEAWEWYYRVVGEERCPIIDTWWQTETGGVMITSIPGTGDMKPGSASFPFFGNLPALVNDKGDILEGATSGNLVLTRSWPGQMRTVYGDHQRFIDTYFKTYPGYYFTGDGGRRDEDGFYWITGRVDDVINVSGHRIGTAEVESALVLHHAVAEAAVVGYPHEIKGQDIYAYVTLCDEVDATETLKEELQEQVRKEIGGFAIPNQIQWTSSLPKTRSGKIMRRILRKIASNDIDGLGDISTLADATVIESLISQRAVK